MTEDIKKLREELKRLQQKREDKEEITELKKQIKDEKNKIFLSKLGISTKGMKDKFNKFRQFATRMTEDEEK